ncbi:50S ribosomal protein L21 [Francisellaceae bacterium]|nr:50S ribosomal protein L21 [Francisellaceae bacterium]
MYAIIKSGGKQHKAKEGLVLQVEKIEAGIGETVEITDVLMVSNGDDLKIGTPFVKGSKVIGEVVEQGRHKKVKIIKFRRRKHSMTRQGHRQYFTAIKITSIKA